MSSFRGESLEDFADDFQSIFSENEEDDHDGNKIRSNNLLLWLLVLMKNNSNNVTSKDSCFLCVLQSRTRQRIIIDQSAHVQRLQMLPFNHLPLLMSWR